MKGQQEDHDHKQPVETDDGKPKEFRGAEEKVPETASGTW